MSLPPAVPFASLARRLNRFWPWGLVIVAILGCIVFFLFHRGSPVASQPMNARDRVPDTSGAVSLADFSLPETRRWRSIPRGTQVCDSATFVCDGIIRTAGLAAARDGNSLPGAILGVPVNRRGSRIHLLQSAENAEQMTEGVPYGRLLFHYTNGASKRIELLLGVHGEDWYKRGGESNEPLADPNSNICWFQRRTGDRMNIRVYHTVFENPLPDFMITTVDFISPLSEGNLLLFGLTINDEPRSLAPSYGPGESISETPIQLISFNLLAATGNPAVGATLAWIVRGPRVRIEFPPFGTDNDGRITFEVPRRVLTILDFRASAPDGSSATGQLTTGKSGGFPTNPVITLAPRGSLPR